MEIKKVFSVLATSAIAASILVACGPQESTKITKIENKKTEELVVWTDNPEYMETAVDGFEKEHKVDVIFKDVEATKQQEKLRLDGPIGKGADVIQIPHDRIGPAAIEGLIQPIEVNDEVLSKYSETSIKAMYFEGKQYGMPLATETPVLVYNKDLLPEAPETLEELYKISKELREKGQYGFLAKFDDYYFAHGVFNGYGAYVFGEKNGTTNPKDLGLNTPEAVEALTFIKKWYVEDLFPSGIIGKNGSQTMESLFTEGKVAAIMTGPWNFKPFADKGINYGVVPLPTLPNGEDVKTFVGVKSWLVSSYSKDAKLAEEFVEFITNEESAKKRYAATNEIVPVTSIIENEMKEDPKAQAVAIQSSKGVPMPNIPEMVEVWVGMESSLQTAITGKQTPKKALDEVVKTIGQQIETNHVR